MARPTNCKKCHKPKRPKGKEYKDAPGYCECGRPPVITKEVLQKLEDAFSNSLPDKEACLYAGISPGTLYNYQLQNPEFVERKEQLKLTPNLAARKTIVNALGDINTAKWWMEKRDPEFGNKVKVEHTGEIGVTDVTAQMSEEEKAALATLRAARRKRIENKIKSS